MYVLPVRKCLASILKISLRLDWGFYDNEASRVQGFFRAARVGL